MNQETQGLSKQQIKSRETKAKIFQAAKRILQKQGYEQLSIKNICEEAGVPKGIVSVLPGRGSVIGDAITKHPLVKRVSFTGGTSTGKTVAERLKGATLVAVPNTDEGAKAVADGRADAFVSDDISLIDQARMLKGAVKVVGPRMSVEPLAPIVPKNAPDFQHLVAQAMKDMYRDGTARQVYRKWFEHPLPVREYSLDLPPDRLLSDTFRRPDTFVTDWTVL